MFKFNLVKLQYFQNCLPPAIKCPFFVFFSTRSQTILLNNMNTFAQQNCDIFYNAQCFKRGWAIIYYNLYIFYIIFNFNNKLCFTYINRENIELQICLMTPSST